MDGFSGRELIFTKYRVAAGRLTYRFPGPRRKDVLLHPVSECKKQGNLISHQRY